MLQNIKLLKRKRHTPIAISYLMNIFKSHEFNSILYKVIKNDTTATDYFSDNCKNMKRNDGGLPLESDYLAQIFHQIGAEFS